jgi:phospholipid transport system substrate-binding protein
MIRRRHILAIAAMAATLPHAARAQSTDKAAAFVKSTGDKLVAVVNGPGSAAAKRSQMTQIIDNDVDVDGIGKFCLGRYWPKASAEQRKQYLTLFHEVLVTNITSKLGEYQGVTFTMGQAKPQGDEAVVATTVVRPNNGPTAVDWIIANPSSAPKIIDVKAEGTSLRLTQRQDYASYLMHNKEDIDALIAAMKNQVSQAG